MVEIIVNMLQKCYDICIKCNHSYHFEKPFDTGHKCSLFNTRIEWEEKRIKEFKSGKIQPDYGLFRKAKKCPYYLELMLVFENKELQ